jgi:hypothetical protein
MNTQAWQEFGNHLRMYYRYHSGELCTEGVASGQLKINEITPDCVDAGVIMMTVLGIYSNSSNPLQCLDVLAAYCIADTPARRVLADLVSGWEFIPHQEWRSEEYWSRVRDNQPDEEVLNYRRALDVYLAKAGLQGSTLPKLVCKNEDPAYFFYPEHILYGTMAFKAVLGFGPNDDLDFPFEKFCQAYLLDLGIRNGANAVWRLAEVMREAGKLE